jgi:CheY-like chemotaxis protein
MTEHAGNPQREGISVVVKVLYIEDNDDDVYMLKMRLELLGNFEVLTAKDGEKGCEVAAAERWTSKCPLLMAGKPRGV